MRISLLFNNSCIWVRAIALAILATILGFSKNAFGQAVGDYRSFGGGTDWNTAANWERCVVAGAWPGVASANYPGQIAAVAGSSVTIRNGHTRIIDANTPNSIVNLIVGEGTSGTMSIGANAAADGYTLTCSGAVTINNGGTINGAGNDAGDSHTLTFQSTLLNNGTITLGAGTDQVALSVTGPTTNNGSITFGSNTEAKTFIGSVTSSGSWTSTGLTSNLFFRNGVTTTGGTFLAGGATFNTTAGQSIGGSAAMSFANPVSIATDATLTGTAAITFNNTVTLSGATTDVTNTNTNTVSITGTGAAQLTGTAGSTWVQGVNSTFSYSGSTLTNVALTATASPNTVIYAGGNQTAIVTTYDNLTISGTNTKTFANSPTVNGILSMEGTASVTVSGGPTVSYGSNATLRYNKSGAYVATSEEWVTPFLATGGVVISNTGAITQNDHKVFGNNTNVPLNINAGATLLTNNNDLTFHGEFINDGTLTAGASDIVITGTFTPQSIDGFTTTGTVSMTKSSGTATLNGDVNGASLVINGTSGTLNLGSGLTHTFTGDWTRTAGTVNGGSSTLNIGGNVVGSGGTFTAGTSTVDYTGAAQITAGVNYFDLTFSGSGAKTLAAGTTAIGGDFTLSGTASTTGVAALTITGSVILGTGTSFTAGAFTHNITGDWSNNGGTFTGTGSTINFNGADQGIGGTSATTFNNLTLAGSGIKTISASPTINGNLTLSGTASTSAIAGMTIGGTVILGSGTTFTAGPYTHNVAGNWTNNGGTFSNAGSTINFNGTAQAIGGTSSTTFNSISLAGSGTKTFNIGTTTADRFTINTGAAANLGTFAHTTNTLRFDAVGQAAGTWGGTGSSAANINTTFFAAATGILTVAVVGSTTYYSRQSGNWNATTTWSTVTYGNATNTGTFPVAGDIVNIGGGNFTITVNVNSACTLLSFLGGEDFDQTVSLNAAGRTLNVSGAINLVDGDGFGDTNTVAVGAGTLNAGSFAFSGGGLVPSYQLTISTGTATVSGDVTQSGLGSAIVAFSGAGLLRVGGDLPNATFLTPSTGTVEYFGSGDQNVSSLVISSYNNVTFSGAGVKSAGGDTDINGVFTLGSGTSFVGGPNTYTLGGNWVNNGTTFTNTNFTVTLDGGAQSIGGTTATTFNNLTLSGGTKAFSLVTTINGLLSINSGALANLGSITTHFARSLALAGAGAAVGSWGSTASAATNQNNTYFTAGTTGILNVSNRAYFSRQAGNWNVNATWSTVTYGNATNTGTFPVAGDIANVGGGDFTVTVNVNSACATLNFQAGANNSPIVSISGTNTLDVSEAVNIPGAGTLFSGDDNTLAVGAGTLNAGNIAFSTGSSLFGSHVLTISTGTVNVTGDVIQSFPDAIITFSGSGQLRLGGAFLNSTNCTFTASTSTVHYQGAVAQTIGDFTYYNLTLNNTSGSVPQLTLYDDAIVSSTLTMTSGIIDLNSSTLQLGTAISPANIGTLSYTSGWMYEGTFRRYFTESIAVTLGTVNGLFPLGTSSDYRPLYLGKNTQNNSGGALNVSHNGTNNGSSAVNFLDDNGTVVMRSNSFWTVSKASGMSGTGTPYSIQAGGTGFGTIQEVDDLRLTQAASEVGTTSLPNSGTTSSPLVRKISISNANLARNYYIGSVDGTNSPLPISLLYFKASLNGNVVTTTWATAQELNNAFFTIERASNIENFEPVGIPIAGAGTTKVRQDYSMNDENPLYGRSYYRLKQTDFDRRYSYSNVQVVDYEGPQFASLRAYPNPSDGTSLTVLVTGLKGQASVPIQIYNVQGQMVYESILDVNTTGTLKHEIEFGNPLRAGVYLIKAGQTLQLTQKIFIR